MSFLVDDIKPGAYKRYHNSPCAMCTVTVIVHMRIRINKHCDRVNHHKYRQCMFRFSRQTGLLRLTQSQPTRYDKPMPI